MSVMNAASLASDQRKFLAAKLLRNVYLKLVAASVCSSVKFERGTGLTGTFVRYKRMNVPVATLAEGQDPTPSAFTIETVTVTLDQWGDVLQITDVAVLTTAHPVMQLAQQLLADNAQRVIDREVQLVWLAGTTIQFGDGSVVTRGTITKDMKASDDAIGKAYVTLGDGGAQPRGTMGGVDNYDKAGTSKPSQLVGPNAYLGISGVQITQDIRRAAMAYGTWAAARTFNDEGALNKNFVGQWNGINFVETNFIPKFTLLGNTTTAVVSTNAFGTNTPVVTAGAGGAGTLAQGTTFFFKVTEGPDARLRGSHLHRTHHVHDGRWWRDPVLHLRLYRHDCRVTSTTCTSVAPLAMPT
jgi:N4-gp56 family major capsid protein